MSKLDWFSEPLTKGLDLDDPLTTSKRVQIIQKKLFLRKIYEEWYELIRSSLPEINGPVVELGSGAGFLNEIIPGIVTSEVFYLSNIDLIFRGENLPFSNGLLRALVMVDVLHHIPSVRHFFQEVTRCVSPGGRIILIEPWVSTWSKLIYQNFHHEPFDPQAVHWEFPPTGPLSGANGALPWIIFQRDRAIFEQEFPMWKVHRIRPFMPFRYLVCGGVSKRSLVPVRSFSIWRDLEKALEGQMRDLGMFAHIILVRQ